LKAEATLHWSPERNLAVVGDELIQFGVVEPLGARTFRLSRLLRGRRGTERLESEHQPGAPFILVEREKLNAIDFGRGLEGAEAMLLAQSVGDDDEGVLAAQTIHGRSLRPPSPVHFQGTPASDGAVAFSWTRRSRNRLELAQRQRCSAWRGCRSCTAGTLRGHWSSGGGSRIAILPLPSRAAAEDGGGGTHRCRAVQVGTYGRSGSSKLIKS
jgi:hypothetical protein